MSVSDGSSAQQTANEFMERVVQLVVVALLALWCFQIARPFLLPVLWGVIIAVALYPIFLKIEGAFGGKSGLAAAVFGIVALAVVMVPTYFVASSLLETGADLADRLEGNVKVELPPPSENVRGWPVVGDRIYDSWALAAEDPERALRKHKPQLTQIGASVLEFISGAGAAVAQSIFSILIAAIFLGTASGGKRVMLAVGERLGEEMGRKAVLDAAATIGSVAKGVLGVAIVQGLAASIGLFWMGIPAAGLWTVVVMVFAVVQLPPVLVLGPICIWVFASGNYGTTAAVFFTIWSLLVAGADGFLKPLFLGRGVEIPMPVILIGAIGGMISMGIIGLFLGAIVLSIGYSLFMAWIGVALPKAGEDSESDAPMPDVSG